jgi:hypothetical protein
VVVRAPSGVADTLELAASTRDSLRREAVYRPREAGWHRVDGAEPALAFQVQPASGWAAYRAAERLDATRRRLTLRPTAVGTLPGTEARQPLPLWWAFALFVAAAAWLWARREP